MRSSVDTGSRSVVTQSGSVVLISEVREMVLEVKTEIADSAEPSPNQSLSQVQPPPITVTPATPAEPDRKFHLSPLLKCSSMDRDGSTGKKVQQMLKNRVHKGQAKISTISRKIGQSVVRNGHLKCASSAPGKVSFGSWRCRISWLLLVVFQNHNYQASLPYIPAGPFIHCDARTPTRILNSDAVTVLFHLRRPPHRTLNQCSTPPGRVNC